MTDGFWEALDADTEAVYRLENNTAVLLRQFDDPPA